MATLKFLPVWASVSVTFMVVVVAAMFISAESTIYVYFSRVPPPRSRSSNAVFQFLVETLDGYNACKRYNCSFQCELDGKAYPCHGHGIVLKNLTQNQEHYFLLNVTTNKGERNSSVYSWFIDTIPPTAAITSEETYTSGKRVAIDITFSELCTGLGGFKCQNSTNCDVLVAGPAQVVASSFQIIKPGFKYSLDLILSSKIVYGHAVISMVENTCADQAGNKFMRTNGSTLIIHFDRRPVMVDFWTSVPSYELKINSIPRTVIATCKPEDMIIFLDFSIPIRNSTEQILSALHVNSSILTPFHDRSNEARRFSFMLNNISRTEIITIELQATSILGRTGIPVSPVAPITFLFDSMRPSVILRTSSLGRPRDFDINIIAEFTKPVFGFDASMIEVLGGRLTRLQDLSRALYSLTVHAESENEVSVTIPAGKVTDISGNENLASNQLVFKHYSAPAICIALYSFVSAGTIATSLIAAMVLLSSANLEAISILALGGANCPTSNPSMNLNGMVGHLQVFALTSWFSADQPVKYLETTRGLRWLIPHHKLPWTDSDTSSSISEKENLAGRTNDLSEHNSHNRDHHLPTKITTISGWLHNHQHNISRANIVYGLPLSSIEYFSYFLRGEPMSASMVAKGMENYKGWQDMEMNLFWLGIGGGCLILAHVFIILFLRRRTGKPPRGSFSVPRFELFILILLLPCLSQSSAFLIKGGSTRGIITGVLLLAIPAAFILSASLFIIIVINSGKFARYEEFNQVPNQEVWYKKLWFLFVGKPTTGKWFYRDGLPSSFLSGFGILFDNCKGSPVLVLGNQHELNTMTKWTESGQSGNERIKGVNSEDSNEENKNSIFRRVLGCMQQYYIILDLLRRVGLGMISVAYPPEKTSKSLFALVITLVQFIYLFTIKPYISRSVHVVESVSLLCEAGVFGIFVIQSGSKSTEARTSELIMIVLLLLTFIAQLINQWYAMVNTLLRLSKPQTNSLRHGLKLAAKGLILPFLPKKHWPSVVSTFSQTETEQLSVNPASSGTELGRRKRAGYMDPVSAMTATVVPVQSLHTPSPSVIERRDPRNSKAATNAHIEVEGIWLTGHKAGINDELKMLRELAKAGFSREDRVDEASTSYTLDAQPPSDEHYLGIPKPRY
ncbi:hypothetical protein HN51_041455 [Arachis hypogaea]|uniref:uncharacterized protein n=2 Tax=Arachis TaxID=3817 RepID=UPI000A2B3D83|nr:uncharacterized protein LOC107605015 isoform X1 [Arachis ipaensis]XP_025661949.1 uncharacterized protein LOC112757609 isoform X1 [Arachis hypogaea]QHN87212.1 uncharacterized protein DS421_16g553100 [Arachis hypogaea]